MSDKKHQAILLIGIVMFLIGLICLFYPPRFSKEDLVWVYTYRAYVVPLISVGTLVTIIGIILSNVRPISNEHAHITEEEKIKEDEKESPEAYRKVDKNDDTPAAFQPCRNRGKWIVKSNPQNFKALPKNIA